MPIATNTLIAVKIGLINLHIPRAKQHWIPDFLCIPNINYLKRNWRLLLLPNTVHIQQVEDYVKGCEWQLKNVKVIDMFHRLVYDRGYSSLECFNSKLWIVAAEIYKSN